MRFSRTHQSHAASCRHAPTRATKARFWNELDAQYEEFRSTHKSSSIAKFCAIQRTRLPHVYDALGVKLRTAASWLRAWPSKQGMPNSNEYLGDAQ